MNPTIIYSSILVAFILIIAISTSYLYSTQLLSFPSYQPPISSIRIDSIDLAGGEAIITNLAGVRYDAAIVVRYVKQGGGLDIQIIPVSLNPGQNIVKIQALGRIVDSYITVGGKWFKLLPGYLVETPRIDVKTRNINYTYSGIGTWDPRYWGQGYATISIDQSFIPASVTLSLSGGYYRDVCNKYIYTRAVQVDYGTFCKLAGYASGATLYCLPCPSQLSTQAITSNNPPCSAARSRSGDIVPQQGGECYCLCIPIGCPNYESIEDRRETTRTYICADPYPCFWLDTISLSGSTSIELPKIQDIVGQIMLGGFKIFITNENSTSPTYAVKIDQRYCRYKYREYEHIANTYRDICGDEECSKADVTRCHEDTRLVFEEERDGCEGKQCAALKNFLTFSIKPYDLGIVNASARLSRSYEASYSPLPFVVLDLNTSQVISYSFKPEDPDFAIDPDYGDTVLRLYLEIRVRYLIPGIKALFGIRYNEFLNNVNTYYAVIVGDSSMETQILRGSPQLFSSQPLGVSIPRNIPLQINSMGYISNPLAGANAKFYWISTDTAILDITARYMFLIALRNTADPSALATNTGSFLAKTHLRIYLIPILSIGVTSVEKTIQGIG